MKKSIRIGQRVTQICPSVFLFFTFCLFGVTSDNLAFAVSTQPGASVIGIISNFPRKIDKHFVTKIQELAGKRSGMSLVRFDFFCTIGDPDSSKQIVSRPKQERPQTLIFLDANSAAMVGPQWAVPCIAIVSAHSAIEAKAARFHPIGKAVPVLTPEKDSVQMPDCHPTYILETLPKASMIAHILANIKPQLKTLGLVCVKGDTAQEAFLHELGSAMKALTGQTV